jgi:hypothetical protein
MMRWDLAKLKFLTPRDHVDSGSLANGLTLCDGLLRIGRQAGSHFH